MKTYKVTLPSRDVESFLIDCQAIDWLAYDTGERIMTDDGPDGEAVLLVEPTPRATTPRPSILAPL
jgi:hypothetical protein